MSSQKSDIIEAPLDLVDIEYDANKDLPEIQGQKPFGALIPLKDEAKHLESMRDMVERYIRQEGHAHPLCLAVFGPPGSGKSFAVKQIQTELEKHPDVRLSRTTINLTQLSSPAELTAALATASNASKSNGTVPIVFFDEFDTARNGAAYGWLSSFLAPMHDGEFLHNGEKFELKKAIYVFAGGTASTWTEFISLQSNLEFLRAKGPDFISRLRGFLDVAGPNEDPREARRALILRSELHKRVKRNGSGKFRVDRSLLEAFLGAGRYLHGARSIAALIETIELNAETLGWDVLPQKHLLAMQVDRGPLDPRAIGGSIALSGFAPVGDTKSKAQDIDKCWKQVAKGLWTEGATLAYAGRWRGHGVDLSQLLIYELSKLPLELSCDEEPCPRFRSFLKESDSESRIEADRVLGKLGDPKRRLIKLVDEKYLNEDEKKYLNEDEDEKDWEQSWKTRAIERFRRRLAVSEASVARFIIGGNRDPDTGDGRPSGVVEEAIQSLALRRPIYLAGDFGGATSDLGVVLGLSSIRTGAIPNSLGGNLGLDKKQWLREIEDRLRPPPLTSLPVLPDDQVAFLREHALGGPRWPENGLSPEENRKLFRSDDPKTVRDLTIQGLRSVFSGRAKRT